MTSQSRPPRSPRSSHRLRSRVTDAGPSSQRPYSRANPRGSLPERARVPVTWDLCLGQLGLSKVSVLRTLFNNCSVQDLYYSPR